MNTTISNNGLPPLPPPTSAANNGSSAAAGTPVSGSGSGADNHADDQLKLTDSARALQAVARASDGAVVDQQRVDKIREALANGSYQINPTRIAEQMLAFEQQLGGSDKA